MKALTLKHPWPFAICFLGKRIENRTWAPPRDLLGQRIAIHGGKMPTSQPQRNWCRDVIAGYRSRGVFAGEFCTAQIMSCTGIVATAVISHTVRTSDDPWFDGTGYGWVLTDVLVLPNPIPCKGAQRLWNVPADIESVLI